jgi:hypothetical protein
VSSGNPSIPDSDQPLERGEMLLDRLDWESREIVADTISAILVLLFKKIRSTSRRLLYRNSGSEFCDDARRVSVGFVGARHFRRYRSMEKIAGAASRIDIGEFHGGRIRRPSRKERGSRPP